MNFNDLFFILSVFLYIFEKSHAAFLCIHTPFERILKNYLLYSLRYINTIEGWTMHCNLWNIILGFSTLRSTIVLLTLSPWWIWLLHCHSSFGITFSLPLLHVIVLVWNKSEFERGAWCTSVLFSSLSSQGKGQRRHNLGLQSWNLFSLHSFKMDYFPVFPVRAKDCLFRECSSACVLMGLNCDFFFP